jgi:hypothetical protein
MDRLGHCHLAAAAANLTHRFLGKQLEGVLPLSVAEGATNGNEPLLG